MVLELMHYNGDEVIRIDEYGFHANDYNGEVIRIDEYGFHSLGL